MPVAEDPDLLRVLLEPMPPALILARVAKWLRIEPPKLIQQAVAQLQATETSPAT